MSTESPDITSVTSHLNELHSRATEGQWFVADDDHALGGEIVSYAGTIAMRPADDHGSGRNGGDFAFIVAVKNEWPQIASTLSSLNAEIDEHHPREMAAINRDWNAMLARATTAEARVKELKALIPDRIEIFRALKASEARSYPAAATVIDNLLKPARAALSVAQPEPCPVRRPIERARQIVDDVEWVMDNHLPAKGETGAQCYRRRLIEGIAEALSVAQPEPCPVASSDHHVRLLGEALGRVLGHAGMIREGHPMTGPELLMAADTFCEQPAPGETSPSRQSDADLLVNELIWHVEQLLGTLSRETSVTDSDSDWHILQHNFRAALAHQDKTEGGAE